MLCGQAILSFPFRENFINRRSVGKRFSRQTEKISATRKSLRPVRRWLFRRPRWLRSAKIFLPANHANRRESRQGFAKIEQKLLSSHSRSFACFAGANLRAESCARTVIPKTSRRTQPRHRRWPLGNRKRSD